MEGKGRIKTVVDDRGFCFIEQASGGKDVFAHATVFNPHVIFDQDLRGQAVVFDLVDSEKGPKATRVTLVTR